MKQVDMSPAAITQRLKLVSHLRDLCLSLGKAGEAAGLRSEASGPKKASDPQGSEERERTPPEADSGTTRSSV